MPDLLITPNISVTKVRPPATLMDGFDGNLTDVTGVSEVQRGTDSYSIPNWAKCGVKVESDCGCYPKPYEEKYCHNGSHPIATNFPVSPELPLGMIFQGGSLEMDEDGGYLKTAQPKTYTPRGCCYHSFKPMSQYLRLKEKERCEEGLQQKAIDLLQAYSHRLFVDQLMNSMNGNIGIPAAAEIVNPLDDDGNPIKISECSGLTALQENHGSLRQLIAPMSAINMMLGAGLLGADERGLFVLSSGTRIIRDPAWKGLTGPPLAGPTDGQTPFDPANELTTLDPDDGCVWMYMVGPIYGAEYLDRAPTPQENGHEDQRGNTDSALAELQTLAVFDPCDVVGVLIDVNKVVGCGS